jgi:hypothetical protein
MLAGGKEGQMLRDVNRLTVAGIRSHPAGKYPDGASLNLLKGAPGGGRQMSPPLPAGANNLLLSGVGDHETGWGL